MLAIRQTLVEDLDSEGLKVRFVVLEDNRCAVLHGERLMYIGAGDQAGVEAGITLYSRIKRFGSELERNSPALVVAG